MTEQDLAVLARRLDVIASLLTMLVAQQEAAPSMASRIMILHEAGLGPADIGRVVGRSTEYVTGVTSRKRKSVNKERGG